MAAGKCNHYLHEDDPVIDWETFGWKGCWDCYHFQKADDFPFVGTKKAAERLGVSQSTIRRWVKKGELEGHLKKRGRNVFGNQKKYFIDKESLKQKKSDFVTT